MFKTCNLFILIILYTLEVLEIKSKPEMFVCNMQIDIQRLQDLNDSWIMNAILQIPQINSYLLTQVVVNFSCISISLPISLSRYSLKDSLLTEQYLLYMSVISGIGFEPP